MIVFELRNKRPTEPELRERLAAQLRRLARDIESGLLIDSYDWDRMSNDRGTLRRMAEKKTKSA